MRIIIEEKEQLPGGWIYQVNVKDGDEGSSHEVELSKVDYEDLSDLKVPPEKLVEKSFEFLLSREPKESILGQFNLMEIGMYFPEFSQEVKEMLN